MNSKEMSSNLSEKVASQRPEVLHLHSFWMRKPGKNTHEESCDADSMLLRSRVDRRRECCEEMNILFADKGQWGDTRLLGIG